MRRCLEDQNEGSKHTDAHVIMAVLWTFWRDALKSAADREAASAESRKLAKNAVELMDAIDRSVQS